MAKYTYELREVISTFGEDEVKSWFSDYQLSDYLSDEQIKVIQEKGVWSKDQLANRILDHYYTREIGTDAIGQFRLFIRDKLREVMETYAPILYSTSINFDPISNMNYTETYKGTTGMTSNTSSRSDSSGLSIASDTPQGEISKSEILNGKYASSTSANESEGSSSGNSTSDGTEDYVKNIKGNNGQNVSKLLTEYRRAIRAVNTEIVYALEPLFMGIY